MSSTFLVCAGHRSVYKCIQQCSMLHLYKNVIKNIYIHSAMQYCISVKGEDTHLTEIKNFKFKDVNTNSLDANTRLKNLEEQNIDKLSNDEYNKRKNNRIGFNNSKKDIFTAKRLERLYQQPHNYLLEIYRIVCHELNDQTLLTSSCKQDTAAQLWEFTYNIKWPENMSFKGVAKTKSAARKSGALKCLEWLQVNHKLKNGKPIIYDKKKIRDMLSEPCELNVAPEILDDMDNLIQIYEKTSIAAKNSREPSIVFTYNQHATVPDLDAFGHRNIIKEETSIKFRNRTLYSRLREKRVTQVDLPIHEFRQQILSMLEHNQILLIEGDTGCGKSTQVPQFILDSYASNGNATDCNIIVSQPRKISAMSLADRVAYERGEITSDVVGYQVRLENKTPQEYGRILYCTTGILLRKLQCTPGLDGCSHVILDEAHERSIDTDMLLILLKRALNLNPDLKVLIMSATMNTHLFKKYFDCPSVKVPGRLYPVKMHFWEDIQNLPDFDKWQPFTYKHHSFEKPNSVDCRKIVHIIKWISGNKPHGAILCFLPGWAEISQVQKMLEDDPLCTQKQLVLSIHSKESHQEQRKIFQPVTQGTRKIILATDIAETGITVPDVCYVVDSAIHRDVRWDDTKDLLCMRNNWVSQANIQQRKGRAGRVQPGESYHLIRKAEYDNLSEYPLPQILSTSLEKIILDSKMYSDKKAEVFLSDFLQPPALSRIRKGVNYLIDHGILDNEENLTALGKRLTTFTTHPKFGKALVYSAIFNCIHPVITIASIFSGEDSPFYSLLGQKAANRENKTMYHPWSDHSALSWIFKTWYTYQSEKPRLAVKYCTELNLRSKRMKVLSALRDMFLQQMISCLLLSSNETHAYDVPDVATNKYEDSDELVGGILYSATQQLIEHKNVGFKNGILKIGVNELRMRGKIRALVSGDSVNYKRKVWPSSYMTYFLSEHCDTMQRAIVRETSIISPLTVLLFNQREVQHYERDDKTEIQVNVEKQHTINLSCDKRTADTLLKFRDIMWSTVQYSLETQGCEYDDYGSRIMANYKTQLLDTLVKALNASSKYTQEEQDQMKDENDDEPNV